MDDYINQKRQMFLLQVFHFVLVVLPVRQFEVAKRSLGSVLGTAGVKSFFFSFFVHQTHWRALGETYSFQPNCCEDNIGGTSTSLILNVLKREGLQMQH